MTPIYFKELKKQAREAIKSLPTTITGADIDSYKIHKAGWLMRSLPTIIPKGASRAVIFHAHFDDRAKDWLIRVF